MEDITKLVFAEEKESSKPETDHKEMMMRPSKEREKSPNYIKILLKETGVLDLYESPSVTVPKESELAESVNQSNDQYTELIEGSGKNRRTATAEAQTGEILYKTRAANTDRIRKIDTGSFVSNYDMFDTYAELEMHVKQINLDVNASENFQLTSYSKEGMDDADQKLSENENFRVSSMVLERMLAGNIFREKQKRFRNMNEPDPLDVNIKYLYRLEPMWTYRMVETMGKAVISCSWNSSNGDLLAIAYGTIIKKTTDRRDGFVCIWSIKNPINPERRYRYSVPVTAVKFSTKNPQLIAIGLYDGSIEILDITDEKGRLVGRSERMTSPVIEPIWDLMWINATGCQGQEEVLAACQDGRIMKFSMTKSVYLRGYQQLFLDHAESVGQTQEIFVRANRHPQALCLTLHPTKIDTYIVGTDEGFLYTCSTDHPHQHLSMFQVHNGSVYSIAYSPWSPKIFLTCGSDWLIRIWVDDIFEPLLELPCNIGAVLGAQWSPIHSTILISCQRNSVAVWDLRKKNMKPASMHPFGSGTLGLTIASFSNCGRTLIVGDEEGKIYVLAMEDMPFSPHYQYQELQAALYRGLTSKPELLREVKSLGYLGY